MRTLVVVLVLMVARLAGAAPAIHVTVTGVRQTERAPRIKTVRARFADARVDAPHGAYDVTVVESRTRTGVTVELRVVVSDAGGIRSMASVSARAQSRALAGQATRDAVDAVVERLRPRGRVAAR